MNRISAMVRQSPHSVPSTLPHKQEKLGPSKPSGPQQP